MKEKKKKERLDVLLVKRGLAESREKAKAIIMTGNVFVEEQREDKAGSTSAEEDINWKRQWNFGMCHYRTSCVWT